ncbi:MAG: RpiB/LacA/LacB family sugar-phosphate isomerase [Thermoguttaceae bacterium]
MNRRHFLHSAAGLSMLGSSLTGLLPASETTLDVEPNSSTSTILPSKNQNMKKILIAADPFAIQLKDTLLKHLTEKGYEVVDLGATPNSDIPYYESAPKVCKAIQNGDADRAVLLCGTGMGMSIVANRFQGIVASVVESVFAARMCRVINNANVICFGSMIWGDWMAKDALDTFLETKFTDGLSDFADFLKDAEKKVAAIKDK